MKIYKLFLLILCAIYSIIDPLGSSIAFADSLNLTTEIGTGILRGTIGEYVYYNDRTLSQLNWNIDYLWYHTISLKMQHHTFFVGLQLQNSINTGKIGTIDDSDWADDNNPTVKTHYSKHDNYYERYNSYNINIGLTRSLNTSIHLQPYIGFLYRTIKMSARDGFIQYPPGSPKVPVYGVGIIYEQIYYIPYIALSSEINITEKVGLLAGISFSLFACAEDIDNHVKREIDFYGSFDGIIYINMVAGCKYNINDTMHFTLQFVYEYVPEQKGNTYYIDASNGMKSQIFKNAAGLRYSVYSIQLSLSYNLTLL